MVGKNTSDPYYVLKAASASGQLVELGRSKEIMKELNPTWEAVEVSGSALQELRATRSVRIEVYDWDKNPTKHELIGAAELSMPDLERLLAQVPSLRSVSLISPLHLPHISPISRAVGRRGQRNARRGDAVRRQAGLQLLPQEPRLRLGQPHDQDQLERRGLFHDWSAGTIEFTLVV